MKSRAFRVLRIYRHQAKIQIARSMEFRTDFAIGLITSFFFSIITPIWQYLIFRQTRGYHGWTIEEMIVFQGVFVFWTGLSDMLFGGVRMFMLQAVRKGDLDRVLLKPHGAASLLLTSGFNPTGFASVMGGAIILCFAIPASGSLPDAASVCVFFLLIPPAIMLHLSFTLLFCSLTLTAIFTGRIAELLDRILAFSAFPAEIFPEAGKLVYLVIVPFAIFAYYPAKALMGKPDSMMLVAAAASGAIFCANLLLWKQRLKKYASGGG